MLKSHRCKQPLAHNQVGQWGLSSLKSHGRTENPSSPGYTEGVGATPASVASGIRYKVKGKSTLVVIEKSSMSGAQKFTVQQEGIFEC